MAGKPDDLSYISSSIRLDSTSASQWTFAGFRGGSGDMNAELELLSMASFLALSEPTENAVPCVLAAEKGSF